MHLKLAGLWTNRKTTDSIKGIDSLGPASTRKSLSDFSCPKHFHVCLPFKETVIASPALYWLSLVLSSILQNVFVRKKNTPRYASSIPGISEVSLIFPGVGLDRRLPIGPWSKSWHSRNWQSLQGATDTLRRPLTIWIKICKFLMVFAWSLHVFTLRRQSVQLCVANGDGGIIVRLTHIQMMLAPEVPS